MRTFLIILGLVLAPAFVHAQDDGVLNSAEIINRDDFKLMVHPMLIVGEGNLETRPA